MQYMVMRVLASQATVDLDRSRVVIEDRVDIHIGGNYRYVSFVSQIALRADLQPRTDLFQADELDTELFATDALAERVMAAGCLGIEFRHPEEPSFYDQPYTIRTARGIEKAGPTARRAHLRRVKQARAQAAAS